MARSLESELLSMAPPVLDAGEVYDAHADHVYRSLHRLGVPTRDLPDLLQEVFMVVHRRRHEYDHARPIRAWLWGICLGLVRNYRRRWFRRVETLSGRVRETDAGETPEDALSAQRDRERGARLLASLDPEKRAVFVMFEVEGMSGRSIAELLDVPVGTVHSRLHAARRELRDALGTGGGR